MNHQCYRLIVISAALWGLNLSPVFANSAFVRGKFAEIDYAGRPFRGQGVCTFITGPRADLAANQFILTVGDRQAKDLLSPDLTESAELQLTGTFTVAARGTAGNQSFALSPDNEAAERYFEQTRRIQLNDKYAVFQLDYLDAEVRQVGPGQVLCRVDMDGKLIRSSAGDPTPLRLSFRREGMYFPGNTASSNPQLVAGGSSADGVAPVAASCPTAELAPLGLAPVPAQCSTSQCLVDFKGFQWWTSFQYYGDGSYFPGGGYFYNDGLRTVFAPKNVFVDGQGLHLQMSVQDLGGGPTTAGAEAVLMFNSDGTEANLGYGDYLVSAKVTSASSWGALDPNVAFGAFTFERIGTGSTGPSTNPHREIDLAEISRWGWNGNGACPYQGNDAPLCTGNAQFTLQPYNLNPNNLHRYTIRNGVAAITLVMKWHGANQSVSFEQYDGDFTFATLPASPDNTWTSAADQNRFIPATNCERFHLNLWTGNYAAGQKPNPPPSTLPQEIVVTNFEFRPVQ